MYSKLISLVLLILCWLSLPAVADVDVAKLVGENPATKQKYPLDQSVLLYEKIHYTLLADGRIQKRVHRVRTLFNENACDSYGDPKIHYYHQKQHLKIERCRAYMIDGRKVDSYANAFNRITPSALAKAPDYTGFQKMVITHTGLEWDQNSDYGSTSELIYTITDAEPFQPWLEGIEYFQSDEYTCHKEVQITVPKNTRLYYTLVNGDAIAKFSSTATKDNWVWTMKDIAHTMHNDAYPYRMKFVPTLLFSTASDWQTVAKFVGTKFATAITGSKLATQMPVYRNFANLSELAAEVRQQVRTIHYDTPLFRWYSRSAARTRVSAYGHALDKTILLAAKLQAHGYPVAIALTAEVYPAKLDVPMLAYYRKFWLITTIDDRQLYLDPLAPWSQSSRKDIAGHMLLPITTQTSKPELVGDLAANHIRMQLQITLAEDGSYRGSGSMHLGNIFSPYYQVREQSKGAFDWLTKNIAFWPNLKLEKGGASTLTPASCDFFFEFTGNNLGKDVEGYVSLDLPQPPVTIAKLVASGFHTANVKRDNPLFFKGIGSQIVEIAVEIPHSWQVVGVPDAVARTSSLGHSRIQVEQTDDGIKIRTHKNIAVATANTIAEWHKLAQVWQLAQNRYLIIKKSSEN